MAPSTAAAPPRLDPDLIAELRQALVACDFTSDGLTRALGRGRGPTSAADAPLALRRLPAGEPLTTLLRLFLFELDVSAAEADEALAPLGLEGAARLGLVARQGGRVEALVRMVPSDDLVVASDLDTGRDQVMGAAPSSARLADLTVRRPVELALDLGTGSGIQATRAARHARTVVATDVSERALAFAAFNARLNGVPELELRQGSFFDPVAGERFDLIVSNPPFVISPDTELTYRDAGLRGDAVSELVLRGVADHLTDGGLAHVLVSWAHDPEGDWSAPLRRFVDGSGCDALFLRYTSDDPLGYAARWNPVGQGADREALGETLDRWLTYYRELGIEAMAYGAAVLRRRQGRNWVVAEDAPEQIVPAGEHVVRMLDGQDFLERTDDLAAARLTLVPGHVLEQALRLERGAFAVESATIRLLDGLRFQAAIDVTVAHVLSRLDGERTVREAAAETAAALGADDLSAADVAEEVLPAVRRMVGLGFLVPVR